MTNQRECTLSRVYSLLTFTRFETSFAINRNRTQYNVIPELTRQDGDVSIVLVINGATYLGPVDDPLLSVHEAKDVRWGFLGYMPDYPAKALGCVAQVSYMSLGTTLD